MTIRQKIRRLLKQESKPLTATQIAKKIEARTDSTSGELRKLVHSRVISRKEGVGERGGYGYFISETNR